MTSHPPAYFAGTLDLGDRIVTRMGFGAMRITGEGVWGDPPDRSAAIAVLRRAVELGVDFIDTADSYGPFVSEELIREALHTAGDDPYDGVTIATKAGFVRTGPGEWVALGRPAYLRAACEMSLRRLGLERIELFQLHRIDPEVALEDQLGELASLQDEGKIRSIGLSEIDVDQLAEARRLVDVVSVQNRYNLLDRRAQPVLDACTESEIAFIPWFPIAVGELARSGGPLDELSAAIGASPAQIALAWLLQRSPMMLPIPGTGSLDHLEENVAASELGLTDAQMAQLEDIA